MALDDEAHVIVHIVEFLGTVQRLVTVIDGARTFAEVPVLSAVRHGDETVGYSFADGEGCRGDGVDGEVLGVSSAVSAEEGEDGVRKDEKESEGDERRDDECLAMLRVSVLVSFFLIFPRDASQAAATGDRAGPAAARRKLAP